MTTIDMNPTIAAKSDQLNADDLFGGPRTITITKVSARPSAPDQPIALNFEGDGGKPYLPCKSMRRVLVAVWGVDGANYVGRSMTLFRDPTVIFGGVQVGGIRISHMSHIDRDVTLALSASRSSRKPYTVQPLREAPKEKPKAKADEFKLRLIGKGGKAFDFVPGKWADTLIAALTTKPFEAAKETWADNQAHIDAAQETHPEEAAAVTKAWNDRLAEVAK